jgi:hypothetical protein
MCDVDFTSADVSRVQQRLPGCYRDAVIYTGDAIIVFVMGDCTALLTGVTALMDNGTPLPLLEPATYDSDGGVTGITLTGSWTSTGNRTVQLV